MPTLFDETIAQAKKQENSRKKAKKIFVRKQSTPQLPREMPNEIAVIYRTQSVWKLDEMDFPFDWSDVAECWVKWDLLDITLKNGERHRFFQDDIELDCKHPDELYFDGAQQELAA